MLLYKKREKGKRKKRKKRKKSYLFISETIHDVLLEKFMIFVLDDDVSEINK